MSRPLIWSCLILVLAGPSLAQAEMADDLARSRVETQDGGIVRPIDGGVGDEPIEASFSPTSPGWGDAFPSWAASLDFALIRTVGLLRAAPVPARFQRPGHAWSPPAHARRHVWLQTFLI